MDNNKASEIQEELEAALVLIDKLDAQLADRDAEIAALRAQVAALEAWRAAVPVIALYRYVYNEYEKSLPGTAPVDLKQINAWFNTVQPT